MVEIQVTDALLAQLYGMKVLLRYNSPPPAGGRYGWLEAGTTLTMRQDVVVEQNVGLFGGPYRPLVGGRAASGFCSIGALSYSYSALPEGLTVGRYCSISSGVRFIDSHHPLSTVTTSAALFRPRNDLFAEFQSRETAAVRAGFSVDGGKHYPAIGNDVWIGANATIAMGVEIGTGSVVAANAVVTRSVAPYTIVGGNPARTIRRRFDDGLCDELIASRWWERDPHTVLSSPVGEPRAFLDHLARLPGDQWRPHTLQLGALRLKDSGMD